jgi:hypothetical protein
MHRNSVPTTLSWSSKFLFPLHKPLLSSRRIYPYRSALVLYQYLIAIATGIHANSTKLFSPFPQSADKVQISEITLDRILPYVDMHKGNINTNI